MRCLGYGCLVERACVAAAPAIVSSMRMEGCCLFGSDSRALLPAGPALVHAWPPRTSRLRQTSCRRSGSSSTRSHGNCHNASPRDSLPVSAAARTARLTAAYIGAVGIFLVLAPKASFSLLFDAQELRPLWVRVFGMLCALLAWYYRGAARGGDQGFLEATVSGRFVLSAGLAAIVAMEPRVHSSSASLYNRFRCCHTGPLLLAATNAAGAWSMQRSLRKDKRHSLNSIESRSV
eukprot:TRINITY_DN95211_c0_g1_i1.p1 TRINITY_DN95211_c0_g1~~TRINITY_DN95211_c0_g1_i1.p1  ORF type:complete len:258 (+),score=16.49 TRINITY_DN95211_c0_g1_i1:74-775(+)